MEAVNLHLKEKNFRAGLSPYMNFLGRSGPQHPFVQRLWCFTTFLSWFTLPIRLKPSYWSMGKNRAFAATTWCGGTREPSSAVQGDSGFHSLAAVGHTIVRRASSFCPLKRIKKQQRGGGKQRGRGIIETNLITKRRKRGKAGVCEVGRIKKFIRLLGAAKKICMLLQLSEKNVDINDGNIILKYLRRKITVISTFVHAFCAFPKTFPPFFVIMIEKFSQRATVIWGDKGVGGGVCEWVGDGGKGGNFNMRTV